MNYRLSTLFPSQAFNANKTEIIDINIADPISALIIAFKVGNTANAAPTAHALACLTKIELVDGSDVLFSLSGKQADALDWYHNGVTRTNWNAYLNGMDTDRHVGINFGRHLWDPLLALDPKKFTNLQLKFTIDYDAGGCAPDENTVEIFAALFDEKAVTPEGFLMAKEIKDYARVASTHEYTDLPTDYPLRKLLVACQRYGKEPGLLIQNLKLSEDQDKRVVFDHGFNQILASIGIHSPIYHETIVGHTSSAGNYGYCTPTERVFGTVATWGSAVLLGEHAFYDGDGGRFDVTCAASSGNAQFDVQGWLPHGVAEIPFGIQEEIEDWYDVTKVGSLRADILAGSETIDSETIQIFLQQLRKYA